MENKNSKKKVEVTLYIVKNNYTRDGKPKKGGQFFNIYISRGNIGDITKITDLTDDIFVIEDVLMKLDPTFKRSGGMILKQNEEIGEINVLSVTDGIFKLLTEEEAANKAAQIEVVKLLNLKKELQAQLNLVNKNLEEISFKDALGNIISDALQQLEENNDQEKPFILIK